MKYLLKSGTYIFYPLWIPFLGALSYFLITPRYFPVSIIKAKLLAIIVLSLFIPLMLVVSSKNGKITRPLPLSSLKAKRLFLVCMAVFVVVINNFILGDKLPELIYFFTGILFSIITVFFLSFIKLQVNLHVAAAAAFLGFIIGLSLLYNLNLLWLIALIVFSLGWATTAQLMEKEITSPEIIRGLVVGLLPQLLFFFTIIVHYKM